MEKMRKIIEELDLEIIKTYEEYKALLVKFDSYRGKQIGDKVDEVNQLLSQIQDKFRKLYVAFYFIAERHQLAVSTSNQHHDFIEDIKKAGASDGNQEIKH